MLHFDHDAKFSSQKQKKNWH